jgi:fructose-1,6-bisphosphatase/inositol monophosphatase family enzyme
LTPDIDRVTALLHETSDELVMPRFARLTSEDVIVKSAAHDPDDIVTVVDRQVERQLSRALPHIAPAAVVGEEATHARPELLNLLASDDPVWVIDPIDGTRNFAAGLDAFGTMLAWVVGGRARAAWLALPARGQTFVAEAGGGAFCNGARVRVPVEPAAEPPRGSMLVRYMPAALGSTLLDVVGRECHLVRPSGCAAVEYTDVLGGRQDFVVYYRLLPWDHAAPALILTEAGGFVVHLDGTPYTVRSANQITVVARDRRVADCLRTSLRVTGAQPPEP